jgi:hypothetical protein
MNHQHHVSVGRTTTTRQRIPLAFQKVFLSANRGGNIASTEEEPPHGVRARRWFAPASAASFPPRPENTKDEITKEADKNVPRNPPPQDNTVDELVKVEVVDKRSPRKARKNKKCKVRPLGLRECIMSVSLVPLTSSTRLSATASSAIPGHDITTRLSGLSAPQSWLCHGADRYLDDRFPQTTERLASGELPRSFAGNGLDRSRPAPYTADEWPVPQSVQRARRVVIAFCVSPQRRRVVAYHDRRRVRVARVRRLRPNATARCMLGVVDPFRGH